MINQVPSGPWLSPAKLNLFLYICGRRKDGYHELQTLFQFIDCCDQLYFTVRKDTEITLSSNIDNVDPEDNLVVKAARLLQQHCLFKCGADIQLEKQLPMGGGIGGGSSNAATTLLVLNRLWKCGLSLEQLADLGLRLGADVPIFIQGVAAFAEGVGEKLYPVKIAQPWYVVLHPDAHISTAEVFGHPELPRDTAKRNWAELENASWHNDCQDIVAKLYPEVANALSWLLEYAPSQMTGTGSCVFAAFDSEQQARDVLENCPEHWAGFVSQGLNRSPLHKQLAEFATF
ncbi:4-(cytidine 5'-diphospho)-2-C-methyl-D-erythritol kinase [Aliagarivorans taiwanensis]|uniref:4-(cytidine 5'-diphospho)-2-C-methyl-D-erythritol kinase n=1 Tax=Aliagarivorans taiwanensis TaxID=561966 RepID=UPI00041598D9|nr:4-(cytidine 5'-diphospho)-2-C-methyl-D-erythritol kinase [Aliagarivorans taiwanensis]